MALIDQVRDLGLMVAVAETRHSVRIPARQVSAYLTTKGGGFRFGWVETPTGRRDFADVDDYLAGLTSWARVHRKAVV